MATTDDQATVLIVEDERELADIFSEWLADAYEVLAAYGGAEALETLDDSVDVVLLDRRMPDVSGDEVLETIRERGHDCQVVMVTAVEPDFDIIEMGFDGYVTKPVDSDDLHTIVERMLDRTDFDRKQRDYFRLVAQRAALAGEKREDELAASEEFAELERRIDDLRAEVDEAIADFEDEDYHAMFRDL